MRRISFFKLHSEMNMAGYLFRWENQKRDYATVDENADLSHRESIYEIKEAEIISFDDFDIVTDDIRMNSKLRKLSENYNSLKAKVIQMSDEIKSLKLLKTGYGFGIDCNVKEIFKSAKKMGLSAEDLNQEIKKEVNRLKKDKKIGKNIKIKEENTNSTEKKESEKYGLPSNHPYEIMEPWEY